MQASYDTPAPKTAKADRSIEFGECLLFEDKLATSAQAKLIGGPRAGVLGFQAEGASRWRRNLPRSLFVDESLCISIKQTLFR